MLILPGSFNPLHTGHLRMAHYAEKMTGYECTFVLGKYNADKQEITDDEVKQRKKQFENIGRDCMVTDKISFVAMATSIRRSLHLHPCEKLYFAVGADTITRVNDPKYTFGSQEELRRVFSLFECMNVYFIICERFGLTFDDLSAKIEKALFSRCLNCEGYWDGGESSTALRKALEEINATKNNES